MKYPDVWGKGTIFAFSGIEGKTDWLHPFIATTDADFGQFILAFDEKIQFGFRNLKSYKKPCISIISSDIFLIKEPAIAMIFVEKDGIIGKYSSQFIPYLGNPIETKCVNEIIMSSENGNVALVIMPEKNIFSYSFDSKSKENVLKKAKKTLREKSIEKEITKKLSFFKTLDHPKFNSDIEEKTYFRAISIMKVNSESKQGRINCLWTTPDRWPHRYMWFWDSAFHTFGNRYISHQIAESTLLAVLNCQRKDGFISITMSPEEKRLYENITQPALFAWAALDLFHETKNYDFLNVVYNGICKYIKWLYTNRDKDGDGLLEWIVDGPPTSKCGECGMDNSPRFDDVRPDEPVAAIDLNCFAINEMNCLSQIAGILNKKEDSLIWKNLAEEKKKLVDRFLWDHEDKFYYDRKRNGQFIRIKTSASLLPLLAEVPDIKKARQIHKTLIDKNVFWTDFPIPSTAKNEKTFCKNMWRGGTWLNYNFLVYRGLLKYGFKKTANQLLIKTKNAVEKWYKEKGSIFEFYDPDNKIPPQDLPRKDWLGTKGWTRTIADYHWSAAIYVAFVHELRKENYEDK
ncbi:MAG: amylo-alpha-1,6-glucosidase [Candidatus Ratteibacteria bacterium]